MSVKSSSRLPAAHHPTAWDGLTVTKEPGTLNSGRREALLFAAHRQLKVGVYRWAQFSPSENQHLLRHVQKKKDAMLKTRHSCSICIHKHTACLLNRWSFWAPRNSQAKHGHNTISKTLGWWRQQQQRD